MTRAKVLAHVSFLAQWDPAYANRALKWYDQTLPWLGLLMAGSHHNQG